MTSFIERESERRTQERSKLIVPGELVAGDHKESIFVMDLDRTTCRAVVSIGEFPKSVNLLLNLPGGDSVSIMAQANWCKEFSPGRWHVTFGNFEFATPGQEQQLRSYLNEIAMKSEEMGVKALRELGNDELHRLSRMVKASRALNSSQGYIEAIEQVVDVTRRALGAERGLFLVDRGEEDPVVEVARGNEALKQRGLRFSTTVAHTVAESGKPLLSLDAQTDQALGAVMSLKLLGTVSVLCVPLRTRLRHFGMIYVDNTTSRGIFRDSDLALATIIADLAAASLEKSFYHQRALQAERVASAKAMVTSLSRELLPSLRTLEQVASAGGAELGALQGKASHCLALLEQILPLGSSGRRNYSATCLAELFEKLKVDISGVEFPVAPPDGWPQLHANEEQLGQIISTLIRSCTDSKSSQNKVRVLVGTEPRMLRLSVCNKAMDLTSSEMKRLFHPRLNSELSVIQRLVHEHKGLLRAHTEPEGGTVFTVEFPLD